MPAGAGTRRAVFLGRDGVLNTAAERVSRPEEFAWRPGVMHALRALQRAQWLLVVVTNQSGIARGLYGPAQYTNLSVWMQAELAVHGVTLDGLYHCPHLPDAPLAAWQRPCDCHKPAPGMLRRAARDLDIALPASVMLGHDPCDILAGRAAGVAACVRIVDARPGPQRDVAAPEPAAAAADFTCTGLGPAARWLMQREARPQDAAQQA